MSIYELQNKAREEWSGSTELQREYATPEYYWWKRYQRVYCPDWRADWALLSRGKAAPSGC